MDIKQLRQKYPDYNDMSDDEFAGAFHKKFYSDMPYDDFSSKIGVKKKAEEMKPPGYMGIPEAAVSMVSALPGQIAGGLYGLGELMSGKGLDQAANTVQRVQKENFGVGAFEGITDVGKATTKKAGELFAMPGEAAADYIGGPIGKALGNEELGRLSAKLPVDAALNFLPLHLGVNVPIKKANKLLEPQAASPVLDALKQPQEQASIALPEQMELPLETSAQAVREMQLKNSGQRDLFGPENMDVGGSSAVKGITKEQMDSQRLQEFVERAKQDSIVEDFGNNDPMARMPEMRVDENGMPIRADLSMEAQNLQNPLQRNLWGDELPVRTGDNGVPLTQAIDNMARGPAREQAIAALRGHQETGRINALENSRGIPDDISRFEGEGGSLPRKQGGVIDADLLTLGVTRLMDRMAAEGADSIAARVIEKFKGTFNPTEIDKSVRESFDPNARSRLYWMSPDEFHAIAMDRAYKPRPGASKQAIDNANFMRESISETRRTKIRQGLKTKPGLDDIPMLMLEDGVVWGHEGRHRMDVFKEQGLDLVPVRISDADHRNGNFTLPYDVIRGENGTSHRMPQPVFGPGEVAPQVSGLRRTQAGGVDFKAISDEAKKLGDKLSNAAHKAVSPFTAKEEIALNAIGDNSFVPKGDAPSKIISDALQEGQDGPALNTYTQSGLQQAGEKAASALQKGVARWLSYGEKVGQKFFREQVKPLEQSFSALPKQDLGTLMDVLKEEMFNRAQFSIEQLRAAGMMEPTIAAYQQLRKVQENTLKVVNDGRAALGQSPITPQSAYFSSMWNGNYHIPIYTKDGKLAWYVKTETRGEANKALAWMRQHHADTLDLAKLKAEYRPQNIGSRLPKDVTNTFENMLEIFEGTPFATEMSALIKEHQAEAAFNSRQFKVHFESKGNIRGFLGDRPWLSAKKNTLSAAKAQIEYLKEASQWAPMQEALANVKEVLGDERLVVQQPNNIAMAKAYTANALGVSKNLFNAAENAMAQAMGVSPSSIGKVVGDVKTLTYLQQLGFSTGYAIATPLQALILGPALHLQLSGKGIKHNVMRSAANSLTDMVAIMGIHEAKNTLGMDFSNKLSPLGKDALRYMEDNGIITINLFDEYANLGQHQALATARNLTGFTISVPEKIARTATFMSFVHHLNDAKAYNDKLNLFRHAEELTNQTLTNFNKSSRPLITDALGQVGELAYTYKSPLFNYYNNLGALARDGRRTGNYKPLIAALGMTGMLGGLFGFPGMQEVDGMWELFKDAVAANKPEYYKHLEGTGPREFALENLPDWTTFGTVSAATGAQMATRFSTQVMDPQRPLADSLPAASTIEANASILGAVANPNKTTIMGSAYKVLPPILKGQLETRRDIFSNGRTSFNPNKLEKREAISHIRTEGDKTYRQAGLTSLPEAREREIQYRTAKEDLRKNTAKQKSMDKLFDALLSDRKDDVAMYARAYIDMGGDEASFNNDFNKKIEKAYLTPQERQMVNANKLNQVKSLMRRMEMSKQ